MKALVVYESMFGNTERVAAAVARGLRREGVDADLVEVGSAPTALPGDLDLLVVGAPTHAFSLSRRSTRADAVRQGAPAERAKLGLREWLGSVRFDPARSPVVAAFDTRIAKVRWLPKAAGPTAVRLAHKHGLAVVDRPVAFVVADLQGPLVDGEVERAVAWGRQLGAECVDRVAASQSPVGAERHRPRHGRPLPGGGADRERPAVLESAFAHVAQTALEHLLVEALAVVGHPDDHRVAGRHEHVDARGLRMPARVGQRLAEDSQQVGRELSADERPHRSFEAEVGRNFIVAAARSTIRVISVCTSAEASREPRAKMVRRMSLIVPSRSSTAWSRRAARSGSSVSRPAP